MYSLGLEDNGINIPQLRFAPLSPERASAISPSRILLVGPNVERGWGEAVSYVIRGLKG